MTRQFDVAGAIRVAVPFTLHHVRRVNLALLAGGLAGWFGVHAYGWFAAALA